MQFHDAWDPNPKIVDSYAVPEALDKHFAEGSASCRSTLARKSQGAPYPAFSDRDSGLYILRYTGD